MKILFCQISNTLINIESNTLSDTYYKSVYELHKEDGYVRPEHFWEVPLWIAELSYLIKEKELHIVTNIEESIKFINNSDFDLILFSILDVNKAIVEQISMNIGKRVVAGGYTPVMDCNIKFFNSVKDFCTYFNIEYKKGTDYSLFKEVETIPRLQLSTGCLHKCSFCSIPKGIIQNPMEVILQQAYSFKDLKFKLVYIDDKTFGQAKNYRLLYTVNQVITTYNKEFKGFIVQTTASQVSKIDFDKLNIFAVELGIETYDNDVLKECNKPASEKVIDKAVNRLMKLNINVIPNLIIGLPGVTKKSYDKTLDFIKLIKPYHMNVTNLAIYKNTKLSESITVINNYDTNQNIVEKHFNTKEMNKLNKEFSDNLFTLGLQQLKEE